MSMREEVLKLAEECASDPMFFGQDMLEGRTFYTLYSLERFYKSAYLAGAKAMQDEAAKRCDEKYKVRAEGGFPREASTARALGDEIRTINPSQIQPSR